MSVTVQSERRGLALNPAGVAWFVLAIVSALPLFWLGFAGLATEWARPEYSHGPVIPVPQLLHVPARDEVRAAPGAPVTDRWPGVIVIGAGLMLALLGNLVQIDDLVFYALIVWVGGLVLTCFGFKRGFFFWPAVLHLVFMLPLPQFLYWKINTALQFFSSEIGVAFVRVMDVPVFLDGNVIDLGVYKLMVAEACSGLRYLFPIMSFSYVFAVLYTGARWHKAVLLLSAVPIAVLMNALRIGVIGVLVDRYGIGQAEGFLHFFEGWIIFLSCIGLLFLMVLLMQRLSGDRRPLGEAIDLDFTGLGRAARPRADQPALAGADRGDAPDRRALGGLELRPGAPGGAGAARPLRALPALRRRLGGLAGGAGAQRRGDPRRRRLSLGLLPRPRRGRGGRPLRLLLRQPDPRRGHPFARGVPARRRLGGGGDRPIEVTLPGTRFGSFTLNRALIQKGLERQLVYYWFEGRGRRVTNDFAAKFHTVADGLTRGRTDGGLVRVITPVGAERRGGGRRPPAALPRRQRGPPAAFHPGVARTPAPRPEPRTAHARPVLPARLDPGDQLQHPRDDARLPALARGGDHGGARGDRGRQRLARPLGGGHRRGLPRRSG